MSPKKRASKAKSSKAKKSVVKKKKDEQKNIKEDKENKVGEVDEENPLNDSLVDDAVSVEEKVKELELNKKKISKKKIVQKKSKSRVRQWWSFKKKTVVEKKDSKVDVEKEENPHAFTLQVRETKKPNRMAGVIRSISYFGMGKFRHSFIQSLALMLNAGLPLIETLQALEAEVRAKPMKKLIAKITASVKSGSPLWRSMENTNFFSPYEIALVHIGEDAGNLAKNLQYLSEQQEQDHALKQKVKMAMIYPTIVLVLIFVVVMGLGIFVLPNLIQVLFSMNVELPLSTRIVIKVTRFFEEYGMRIAPGSIIAFIVITLLTKYTRFKVITQWFIFHIPGIGRLAKEATIARFGVILGGLLRAGVPLVESLESLVEVTQVARFRSFYKKLLQRITVGDSFSKSFANIRSTKHLLPVSVQQLIVTGERSGTLSETLLKISEIYEQKAEETAEKLPIILEPMLLLIIGGIVGGIAISIITPIYSVVGNVGAS